MSPMIFITWLIQIKGIVTKIQDKIRQSIDRILSENRLFCIKVILNLDFF